MSSARFNNVVDKSTTREIQSKVLGELSEILKMSFGPNGSNTCIKKENALSRYTKDGHTIISAIHYNGIIEQSIKDDIESITRHIVKTVGDGTTSAVLMSNYILNSIINMEKNDPTIKPADIINSLHNCVELIKNKILESRKEFTTEDAYKISMISTNGNKDVSERLKVIYDNFGPGVYIDVTPSTGTEFLVKSYDGMTLNSGYCDSCYVTTKSNTCEVDKPEVYFFEHPIDTREMGVYLDSILTHNIIAPFNEKNFDKMVPTVIFAPKISNDMSSIMDSLISVMQQMPPNNKLPICIITDLIDSDELNDLATMCGAKFIRKYIDRKVFEEDVANGRAPTPETVFEWAGMCDKVISYSDKTTFIRPRVMYNADNNYSNAYYNLLNYLSNETKTAEDNGDIRLRAKMLRRLRSLESNMVEMFVGGITQADRDSLCDLVEDAVLNIRSAANNGVGYGANMSGALAVHDIYCNASSINNITELDKKILEYIFDAYMNIAYELLGAYYTRPGCTEIGTDEHKHIVFNTIIDILSKEGLIYNISEGEASNNVLSSIQSDITVLDTVSKIIGIMATCNQFIVPTAMHNIYTE